MTFLCLTCGAPQPRPEGSCDGCGTSGSRSVRVGELLGHSPDELLLDCIVDALRDAALGQPVEQRLAVQAELLRLRILELERQGPRSLQTTALMSYALARVDRALSGESPSARAPARARRAPIAAVSPRDRPAPGAPAPACG